MGFHNGNLGIHFVHRSCWIHVYSTVLPGKGTVLYQPGTMQADLQMSTLELVGVGSTNNFSGNLFSPFIVPLSKASLILVFVFVDMLVLIVLYSTLFFYIRIQSKKLRDAESSSHRSAGEQGGYEMESGLVYKSATKTFARNSCTPPSDSPRSIEIERSRPTVEKGLTHCYPLVYIVFLTPLSIARLRQFAGLNPSFAFTYAAAAVFDCQDSSTLSSTLQQGKIYSPGRPLCENSDTELLKTNLKHPIRLRITGCIESSLLAILSYPWLL